MNKIFWITYLTDSGCMLFKLFFLFGILATWGIMYDKKGKNTPWWFIVAYFISDPFLYYLFNYHLK